MPWIERFPIIIAINPISTILTRRRVNWKEGNRKRIVETKERRRSREIWVWEVRQCRGSNWIHQYFSYSFVYVVPNWNWNGKHDRDSGLGRVTTENGLPLWASSLGWWKRTEPTGLGQIMGLRTPWTKDEGNFIKIITCLILKLFFFLTKIPI